MAMDDIANGYLPDAKSYSRRRELEEQRADLTFEFKTAELLVRSNCGWLPAGDVRSELSSFYDLQSAVRDDSVIKLLEGSTVSLFIPLTDPSLKYHPPDLREWDTLSLVSRLSRR